MKKAFYGIPALLLVFLSLSGCNRIGEKSASMAVIYAATAVLALLLLIGYCCVIRKRNVWFLLLFTSILVVNTGYFLLASSSTLEEALLANRVSYLGSVFLPLSMLMIILKVSSLQYKKWLPGALIGVCVLVFLIAASPGYLDIYYKEVTLQVVNGVTVLNKVYGPWHSIYLYYLLGYFLAMILIVIESIIRKRLANNSHAIILAVAVFVNIGVWLLEQLVKTDFEMLSVSYIISELFLLGLSMLMQELEKIQQAAVLETPVADQGDAAKAQQASEETDQHKQFLVGIQDLTQTERIVYHHYLAGKTTREVMELMNIKENTLKYHNRNIYSKLGVASRKELVAIGRTIDLTDK